MKILVIEDNPLHQEHLYIILKELNHEVVGIVGEASEVIPAVLRTQPDLILMDIDLGNGVDGIHLAAEIETLRPTPIIFSSGRTEREVVKSAISQNPVSYLAKPINQANMEAAIELAIFRMSNETAKRRVLPSEHTEAHRIINSSIFVKHGSIISKLNLQDIDAFVVAKDRYIKVVCGEEDYLLRSSIKEILDQLPDYFVRTHRSVAINLSKLTSINDFEGTVLVNEQEYPLGQTFKMKILEKINIL